ncbi:UNVERIFIED_CONTAM: hypothetical protein Sradi_6355300 [Sesamum radiatum]|uniref:Uncharacterized protein n=1 Tax=Sesamum radiatum TaxID=300843 RepID=A0AAW2K1J8_SESRA
MAFALVAAAAALGAADAATLGVEGGPALDCELLCVATICPCLQGAYLSKHGLDLTPHKCLMLEQSIGKSMKLFAMCGEHGFCVVVSPLQEFFISCLMTSLVLVS